MNFAFVLTVLLGVAALGNAAEILYARMFDFTMENESKNTSIGIGSAYLDLGLWMYNDRKVSTANGVKVWGPGSNDFSYFSAAGIWPAGVNGSFVLKDAHGDTEFGKVEFDWPQIGEGYVKFEPVNNTLVKCELLQSDKGSIFGDVNFHCNDV